VKSYSHFDITGLHYFTVVAEERSFSRASNRLHIAQPAISRKIKALEDDLGVQLFLRHAKGVDLTEAGESLLRGAYSLFRQIETLHETAVISSEVPRGTVTIGVLPTPGEYIAPRLIKQSKKLFPELKYRIIEGYSSDLQRMLINREIHIAIMHGPTPHPDIVSTNLLIDHLCLVGPLGSLGKPSYTLEEAAEFPLILPETSNLLRAHIDRVADEQNVKLNVVMNCSGFWLIKSLVCNGLGHTIVTLDSIFNELEQGKVAVASITNPSIPWALAVAMQVDQCHKLSLVVVKGLIEAIATERSHHIWSQMPKVDDAA
jgi:LysR family transcriptional regulator, nitrogen assimilation regulatory protein